MRGLLVALAVLLTSCVGSGEGLKGVISLPGLASGGNAGTEAPAAVPVPSSTEVIVLADPRGLVLTLDDLPAGFTVDENGTGPASNEEAAKREKDPETALAQFREWGRMNGYRAGFLKSGASALAGTAAVAIWASIYQSPGGAQAALEAVERSALEDGGKPVSMPRQGDESKAYAIARIAGEGTGKVEWTTYYVVFRKANVLARVETHATSATASFEDALKLTQVMVSRVTKPAVLPTLAPAAGSTATAVPSPTPVATPSPTPSPEGMRILSQGFGGSGSRVGYAFVVENPNHGLAAENVTFQVAAYDAAGTVLRADSGDLAVLWPGERSAVARQLLLPEGTKIDRLEVQVRSGRFRSSGPVPWFRTENVVYRGGRYSTSVTGIVESPYNTDVTNVAVYAVAYDGGGRIVGGGFTYLKFVRAGGKAAVEVGITASGTPARVELYPTLTDVSQVR